MIAKLPPAGDPLEFLIKESRLCIGHSSVSCSNQPPWSKTIELPMNATFGQILALHFNHTPQDIEAAGYTKIVAQALARVDSKVEKAARDLNEFLVTPEELRSFVYGILRQKISEGFLPA